MNLPLRQRITPRGFVILACGLVVLSLISLYDPLSLYMEVRSKAMNPLPDSDSDYYPSLWRADRARGVPHLVVAICGERLEEPLTMLKSAVLLSRSNLVIHIFSDGDLLKDYIKDELESWPTEYRRRINYHILDASFPVDVNCEKCKGIEWKTLFKPCASQRLFLADALKGVDSVLYVDADTLFLAPIDELWSHIYKFNSTQFMGAVPISADISDSPYFKKDASLPYYGPSGINSGVLLMNLTRMRESSWSRSIAEILVKFKEAEETNIFDQALINGYLQAHPRHGYLLTCDWNFRIQQCGECNTSRETGVALIHGYLQTFTNGKIPAFKAVYSAFNQFELGVHSVKHDLLPTLNRNLKKTLKSKLKDMFNTKKCSKIRELFTQRVEEFVDQE